MGNRITRKTILDLANEASHDNRPLCDLLLTVAGMLDADGKIDPFYERGHCIRWGHEDGPFAVGLALSLKQTPMWAERTPHPPVKPARKKVLA